MCGRLNDWRQIAARSKVFLFTVARAATVTVSC